MHPEFPRIWLAPHFSRLSGELQVAYEAPLNFTYCIQAQYGTSNRWISVNFNSMNRFEQARATDRRHFIRQAAVLLGSITPLTNYAYFHHNLLIDLSAIPNFCTHEHWGSIQSIGEAPQQNGFRCDTTSGATPQRETSIWDLFLDPYEKGWMAAGERDPDTIAAQKGFKSFSGWWNQSPADALQSFALLINSSLLTGGYQCTKRGIELLYNVDLDNFNVEEWKKVDEIIAKNYSIPFDWYKAAMQKAHFTELIRPVHPEFYVWEESKANSEKERSFTHTVMRIDPLMDLWKTGSKRRDELASITGIDPADAKTWKIFIARLFDLAAKNKAVGIKQLQAYSRSLDFTYRNDKEIKFRGNLDKAEVTAFQDWVMHECCMQAHERKWVHQVHVGTHNIASSSPLPLASLAKRYTSMNVVMIHCWPFLQEAAFLAKLHPNIYVDSCWLPVLSPAFFKEAMNTWLNYVPAHKIMLGHDSTHVEMAAGSSLFTRELLTDTLLAQQKNLKMSDQSLLLLATDMLQNNAVRVYGFGRLAGG